MTAPAEADYARLGRAVVTAIFAKKGAGNPANEVAVGCFGHLREVVIYESPSPDGRNAWPEGNSILASVPIEGQWLPE